MTPEQFDALAALLSLRSPQAIEAARMVMVEGASVTAAAAQTGLTPQGVSNAAARCRRGLALARVAAGRADG